jgi:hypothetical protein
MNDMTAQKLNAPSESDRQRLEESAALVNDPLRNTSNQEA